MKDLRILLFLFVCIVAACVSPENREAFKRFNEGTAISMEAADALNNGNQVYGEKLCLQAIEKYKQTVELDSNYHGVAGVIGFSYYEIQKFNEAIEWLRKGIEMDSTFAINYQLLGLSQINQGFVDEGEINLKKAFKLEDSDEFKLRTIENLVDIGNSLFAYGESALSATLQTNYKKFGIRVLICAFEFSGNSIAIGKMIDECAQKMNDKPLSEWVRSVMYTKDYAEYR